MLSLNILLKEEEEESTFLTEYEIHTILENLHKSFKGYDFGEEEVVLFIPSNNDGWTVVFTVSKTIEVFESPRSILDQCTFEFTTLEEADFNIRIKEI